MKIHPSRNIPRANDLDPIVMRRIRTEIEIPVLRDIARGIGTIGIVRRENDIRRTGKTGMIERLVDDIVMILLIAIYLPWLKIRLEMSKERIIARDIILQGHDHIVIIGRHGMVRDDIIAHDMDRRMGSMRRHTIRRRKMGMLRLKGRGMVGIKGRGVCGMRMILRVLFGKQREREICYGGSKYGSM